MRKIDNSEIIKFFEEEILEEKLTVENNWDYNLLKNDSNKTIDNNQLLQNICNILLEKRYILESADNQDIQIYEKNFLDNFINKDFTQWSLYWFTNMIKLIKFDKNIKWEYNFFNDLSNSLFKILWKKDIQSWTNTELKNFINKPKENINWKIKVIKDYSQLDNLLENDIVVIQDYPSQFGNYINSNPPKAIIISKYDSTFSHSVQLAEAKNIPVYYFPLAENYFDYFNWIDVEININWKLNINNNEEQYLIPNNKNISWSKYNWIPEKWINTIPLSGKYFFNVLQKYYFLKDEESSWDFNELWFIPYDEIKNLIDSIVNIENENLDNLSKKIFNILENIKLDDKYCTNIEKHFNYPLALRLDFLNEDNNWERTPWLKESYLNIQNKEQLKKYLVEIIKQDFTTQSLEYKKENNIYFLNSTFGWIIQEMVIKEKSEAEKTLSWVFDIENNNWEYILNWALAFWLNSWITDWSIWPITTDLKEKKSLNQNSLITLNSEWWIIEKWCDIKKEFKNIKLQKIKNLIIDWIWELNNWEKAKIEFSIKNYWKENEEFILLQKNNIF